MLQRQKIDIHNWLEKFQKEEFKNEAKKFLLFSSKTIF